MGVGLIPLFLLEGALTPFWISTKYAVPVVENRLKGGLTRPEKSLHFLVRSPDSNLHFLVSPKIALHLITG